MPPGSEGQYFIACGEARGSSIFDLSGEKHGGDVAAIRSLTGTAPPTAGWNTYFWVDSANEAASQVRDAGGCVVVEPFDFVNACRIGVFTDPEGAMFSVWEAKEHKGAQLVNDPGALVFNGLNTRDLARARSFYGSVFGWQTGPVGGGAEGWTLPGYGDWLEREHHLGLRKRLAEAGAPEGFEDIVASIVPIADDQTDTPAHWSVIFATDDADATAARATELGGEVIVPAVQRPLVHTRLHDPRHCPRRPAGRDLRRKQVRGKEQGSRPPGGRQGGVARIALRRAVRRWRRGRRSRRWPSVSAAPQPQSTGATTT